MKKSFLGMLIPILILVLAAVLFVLHKNSAPKGEESLVVYCALDSVYSSEILKNFEKKSGIKVFPKYDTEATKSLGLVEMLKAEKANPNCDVFWSNEMLGMMALKKEGVLTPYKGEGYKRIPEKYKDPEGCWTGLAARLRVYIVNTDKMKPDEAEIKKRYASDDLSRVSMAKPLYGTTLSHYCCLWKELGEDKLKALHEERVAKKILIANGNASSKNAVASGSCDFGWTDSDDFFVAKDDKKPVAQLPIRLDSGKTICIPNTVAIIKGTKKEKLAQKLVDYLLSEECELALANMRGRQIPLGPVDGTKISAEVQELMNWSADSVSLAELVDIYPNCIKWLREKF